MQAGAWAASTDSVRAVREIAPDLFYWRAFHEGIGKDVCSYFLSDSGVLIDPLLPSNGFDGSDSMDWLGQHGPPTAILLSNRHHYRHSGRVVDAFSIPVYASEAGMHEFSPDQNVVAFRFGDQLPGGVIAHEVGVICPDETALEIRGARALALADGVVRFDEMNSPLGFVPDYLLGDDPEAVKAGLRRVYERMLELDFEHLLLAHGEPAVGDGKQQLEAFLEG